MRMMLLIKGFAGLSERLLAIRHPWNAKVASFRMDIVTDSDLKGEEAQALFRRAIEDWPNHSRLFDELGVRQTVQARLATEETEPLLLLSDYVAGVYHHADPRTHLASPIATPLEASTAVEKLRARMLKRLHELPEDFDETFALDHDEHGQVKVRN
jgi:hypothetical protein